MRELATPDERAALLPGGSPALWVVLFWRSSDPAAAAGRERCAPIAWPRGYRAASIDLDAAPEIAAWFDIGSVPTLAVVTDGAILALEYELTDEACRRLAERGQTQHSMMKRMSS